MAESLGKAVLELGADTVSLDRDMDKAKKNVDRDSKHIGNSVTENISASFLNLGKVIGLVKWPALLAGAGAVSQVLGATAAGAVALVSALAPLAGSVFGVAGMYVALGQALAVTKLAFMGLDKAIKGDADALAALSPSALKFVEQVQSAQKEVTALQSVAQKGLLPGLGTALKEVNPLFDRLRPVVLSTAEALGALAVQAGKLVGSDAFLGKLNRVGDENVTTITRLGKGGIAAANAFVTLLDAARPLISWFAILSQKFGEWMDKQSQAAVESGKFASFLDRTRSVMEQLGRIAVNVAAGFADIVTASAPLGNKLLTDLEALTNKFKEWTGSATGQNSIALFFTNAQAPLYALLNLLGEAVSSFLSLTQSKGAAGMISSLQPLIPLLEELVTQTTAAFGPVFVDALAQVTRVLIHLAGTNGPLNMMMETLILVAGSINFLLDTVPGLNLLVVTILGVAGIHKVLSLILGPLFAIVQGFAALAAAEGISVLGLIAFKVHLAASTALFYAMRVATLVAAAAQWLLNAAMTANPVGLVIVAVALLIGVIVLLATHWKQVANFIRQHWQILFVLLTGGLGILVILFIKNFDAIKNAVVRIFGAVKDVVVSIWNGITGVFAKAFDWLTTNWHLVLRAMLAIATAGLSLILVYIINNWQAIKDNTSAVWNSVKSFVGSAWETMKNIITGAGPFIVAKVRDAWNGAKQKTVEIIGATIEFIREMPGKVGSALGGLASHVIGVARDAFAGFLSKVREKVGDILDFVRELPGRIKSGLGNLGSLLLDAGRSLMEGLINGIQDRVAALLAKLRSIAGSIPGIIKKILGIHSPSVVMMGLGENITAGLELGIHKRMSGLLSSLSSVAPNISQSIQQNVSPGTTESHAERSGPLVQIDNMEVTDAFDEDRFASLLSWKLRTG